MTEWASNISAGQKQADDAGDRRGTIAFEDAALVQQCRNGDMQAYGSLVAKYQARVYNAILRLCSNRADADELAQEAFVRALEKIHTFRGRSGFYTWVFRIAVNLTISHRRKAGRVRFQSLTGPDDMDGSQADRLTASVAQRRDPGPEAKAMTADTCEKVTRALDELDDEFRLVVVLRDIEEMDYSQISAVLEVPVGTVKSRLHRARCILKDKLADLVD